MSKTKREPRCPACKKPNRFGLENIVCDSCEDSHNKALTELEQRQKTVQEIETFFEQGETKCQA